MAGRVCEACGTSIEGTHPNRRFCSAACNQASLRKAKAPDAPPPSRAVADALEQELQRLQVLDTYEGQVALGIAVQLDKGTVQGAAYASLSKELDRRVDALRLKAELPDDPARLITGSVAEKRANLRSA